MIRKTAAKLLVGGGRPSHAITQDRPYCEQPAKEIPVNPAPARFSATRFAAVVSIGFILTGAVTAQSDEFSDYRSTSNAASAGVKASIRKTNGLSGHLGLALESGKSGEWNVAAVEPDSPAARAGVQVGERLSTVAGRAINGPEDLRDAVQSSNPGDEVKIGIIRASRAETLSAILDATSNPVHLGERAVLGASMGSASDQPGFVIRSIIKDKPAALAGLRRGDRILSVDGEELGEAKSLSDALLEKRSGDTVALRYVRGNEISRTSIRLVAEEADASLPPEERREVAAWKKPVFRIAVICVDFSNTRRNPAVPLREWEQACFSRGSYHEKNATGQPVYGSMADYYHEVSYGKLRVEGRIFDWVEAPKPRLEYNLPTRSKAKAEFMGDLVRAVEARDGAEVLKDFDGLVFIYAGSKPAEVQRSSILWPHHSSVKIGDRSWSYVIVPEGGQRMSNISTLCHEFGHMLGLPDLYARPENPGSEGAGVWTVMSNQVRNGRPQHFCAWCKEQLGWLTPVVIDPTVKQKLILGPVAGNDHECYKVLVRPDGSEYFLLENRRKTGFDASLPAEGLLIWRVVANRPILEESHGVEGPAGPLVFRSAVPWPSKYNHSFTPYTTPSSRSQLGGGLPVNLTDIRQLPDGRIAFCVGYEFN